MAAQVYARKVDQMREGSRPGPAVPAGAGDSEATQIFLGRDSVTQPRLADSAGPPLRLPTEAVRQPTEAVADGGREVWSRGSPVPSADQAELTAERVWRTGRPPAPPRRPRRLRRLVGSALTVVLLAASGVVLYLRFHHAPFHVTAVVISQRTATGCEVNVTGRIATNGSSGTVS